MSRILAIRSAATAAAVLLIPLMLGGAALAQDKIFALSINGGPGKVALVYATENGTLIERQELRGRGLDDAAVDALQPIAALGCSDCVALESLGQLTEDALTATAELRTDLELRQESELFARAERLRAPLQFGPAFTLNYSVLGRFSEDEQNAQAYVLQPALSLGWLGTLRSGWSIRKLAGGPRRTDQLELRLQRYFVGPGLELELGELRTRRAFNDGGSALIGFNISRDFTINPDLSRSPLLNFYTEIDSPSTVSLFVNGQRRRQQEIDQPGPLRLTDFPAGGSGRVNVVVTDAAGSEQVLAIDLYQDRDLLNPGQVDFSIGAGVLNSQIDGFRDAPLAEGFFRIGVSHSLVFGLSGTYAEYREEDRSTTAAPLGSRYALGRFGFTWRNRWLGKLEASAAHHEDDFGASNTYRVFLGRAQLLPARTVLSVGGVYFGDKGLRSVTQDDIGFEGFRVFGSLFRDPVSLTFSGFRFREVEGVTTDMNIRLGRSGSLGFNMTDSTVADPVYQVRLGMRFGRRANVALTSRYDEATDQYEAGGVVRLSDPSLASRYGMLFSYSEPVGAEPDTEGPRARGQRYAGVVDLRADVGSLRADYRSVDGESETSFNLGGGLIADPRVGVRLTPRTSERSGLVRVLANEPNMRVRVGGRETQLDDKGGGLLPVPAFGVQRVQIDTTELPLGRYAQTEVVPVSVHPGQTGTVRFDIRRYSARAVLPGVARGERVRWPTGEAVYDGQSVLIENPPVGRFEVEAGNRRFTLELPPLISDDAPYVAAPLGQRR